MNFITFRLLAVTFLLQTLTTTIPLVAQSTDPDHPTVLTSGEISMDFTKEKKKYYYTFNASVGEVKLTADAFGSYPWLQISCKVANQDFKTIQSFVWHGRNPVERYVGRVQIQQPQKIILIIDPVMASVGNLKLRVEGAVSFGASTAGTKTIPPATPRQPTSGGQKVIVLLKNGTRLEGTFVSSSITKDGIKNKLTLTIQGKGIPEFNTADVKSITITRD